MKLFELLQLSKLKLIKYNTNQLQVCIFKLRQKYPDIFTEYSFNTHNGFPFCCELYDEIYDLKQRGVIKSLYPGYNIAVVDIPKKKEMRDMTKTEKQNFIKKIILNAKINRVVDDFIKMEKIDKLFVENDTFYSTII